MAANDPGTFVDTPGGRMQAVALFYWNGTAYVASRGGARLLFPPVALVGNGADTSEDTLQSLTLPAGQLANVGDRLRIDASGTFGATTDNKTARVKVGGTTFASCNTANASVTAWKCQVDIIKTGSSTQSINGAGWLQAAATTIQSVAGTLTDTGTLALLVTGQNGTNSVASSVTCRQLTVEFIPA